MKQNITWHKSSVATHERQTHKGHGACVLWYTGLSGSGKSTIANAVDRALFELGVHSYLLDGDNIRHGLNRDLGFDDTARVENIRRVAEVARLFVDAGLIVGSAFISPFREERAWARKLIENQFIEVFVDTPLYVCEQRDPKGLYAKARAGDIPNFTGIGSLYEAPVNPDIHLKTVELSIEDAVNQVVEALRARGVLKNCSI